ncbi:RAxF-45 family protein [Oceanobacillus sp. 1P07AA]
MFFHEMMHANWIEFLYFCRAKFAVVANNGIRVSFFSSLITVNES